MRGAAAREQQRQPAGNLPSLPFTWIRGDSPRGASGPDGQQEAQPRPHQDGSSPKRRRGLRRSRQLRGFTPAERADDTMRRAALRVRSSASSSNSIKAHNLRGSVAARRKALSVCCSSGCETETLKSTSASGRDEPTYLTTFCVSTKRQRETVEAPAAHEAAGGPAAEGFAAAPHEAADAGQRALADSTDPEEPLHPLEPRQQQTHLQWPYDRRIRPFSDPSTGNRAVQMVCQAAAAVSAAAAAAGAAAAACECVRHSTAQTAAALASWSPLALPRRRGGTAGALPAANVCDCGAIGAPLAWGPGELCGPAAPADAPGACSSVPSAATEASRAAYWREELLHRAESRYTAVFIPVDRKLAEVVDCDYTLSDISRYPIKNTSCGIVFYSPRYTDDRYIYRHVLLSSGVRRAAEELARASKSDFLTEGQFIYQLGIHLSPGWEHFMRFRGELRELILRRPQQAEGPNAKGVPPLSEEVSDESDDSETEAAPDTVGVSSSPLRHQDLRHLLQQIAHVAALQQVRQQHQRQQQHLAVTAAVEKAQHLLLQILQLQRARHQQQQQHHMPQPQHQAFDLLKRNLRLVCGDSHQPQPGPALSSARTGSSSPIHRGDSLQLRQQLLLRCVAAIRKQAFQATDQLLLQHRLLRVIWRGADGPLQHQGDTRPALPAPPQQQQQQQQVEANAPDDLSFITRSPRRDITTLRSRKRRVPATAAAAPATPQVETGQARRLGKREAPGLLPSIRDSGSCSAAASAAVGTNDTPVKGEPHAAAAAEAGASPSSQWKQKKRRVPLRLQA